MVNHQIRQNLLLCIVFFFIVVNFSISATFSGGVIDNVTDSNVDASDSEYNYNFDLSDDNYLYIAIDIETNDLMLYFENKESHTLFFDIDKDGVDDFRIRNNKRSYCYTDLDSNWDLIDNNNLYLCTLSTGITVLTEAKDQEIAIKSIIRDYITYRKGSNYYNVTIPDNTITCNNNFLCAISENIQSTLNFNKISLQDLLNNTENLLQQIQNISIENLNVSVDNTQVLEAINNITIDNSEVLEAINNITTEFNITVDNILNITIDNSEVLEAIENITIDNNIDLEVINNVTVNNSEILEAIEDITIDNQIDLEVINNVTINNTEILAQALIILDKLNKTEIKLNLTSEQLLFLQETIETSGVELSKVQNMTIITYIVIILILAYLLWDLLDFEIGD